MAEAADTDADGIKDEYDKCPERSETFNGYQDADGCPDVAQSIPMARATVDDPECRFRIADVVYFSFPSTILLLSVQRI